MITINSDDEKICGQKEIDVAATFDLFNSGHRLKKKAPMTGPAIDAIPATTEFASQVIERAGLAS